ncbi:uncharacterized protein [Rutidosis leptorrhynchoides]|uniref:uncharacterized protein n=1 Tax=Rutidosis leptorrhynchoides TaxID=125765 RepID=UPI003A997362
MSIYGGSGHIIAGGSHCVSSSNSLWLDIVKTDHKVDELGINFSRSMVKTIGNGCSTRFWHDHWLGNEPLKSAYTRLFRLEQDKDVMIYNRVLRQTPSVVSDAGWVQDPYGQTRCELTEINNLLQALTFDSSNEDSWRWTLCGNGVFNTKVLTELIFSKMFQTNAPTNCETLRNNFIPKKVEIFIWWAKRKRLPSFLELDMRGIDLHSIRCPLCVDELESVEHSLLSCKLAKIIWDKVYSWWDKQNVLHQTFEDIYNNNDMNSEVGAKVWQAVKWVCTYLIWRNRNQKVFKLSSWTPPNALRLALYACELITVAIFAAFYVCFS